MEIGDKIKGVSNRYWDFVHSFNKSDKEPDPNLEYIYDHFEAYCDGEEPISTKVSGPGGRKIVVNVKKKDHKYTFNFIDDKTNRTYYSHYSWTLVPNTPENLKRLEEIRRLENENKQFTDRVDAIRKEIEHL
jgi:hypothetical protein